MSLIECVIECLVVPPSPGLLPDNKKKEEKREGRKKMGEKANLYIQRRYKEDITHKKIMCKDQKCFEKSSIQNFMLILSIFFNCLSSEMVIGLLYSVE